MNQMKNVQWGALRCFNFGLESNYIHKNRLCVVVIVIEALTRPPGGSILFDLNDNSSYFSRIKEISKGSIKKKPGYSMTSIKSPFTPTLPGLLVT